jgi:hypothetical protein
VKVYPLLAQTPWNLCRQEIGAKEGVFMDGFALAFSPSPASGRGVWKRSFRLLLKLTLQHSKVFGYAEAELPPFAEADASALQSVWVWSAEAELPPFAEADASALQSVWVWSAEAELPPFAEADASALQSVWVGDIWCD